MYRKVYRQQGGLSNLGAEAFMRQEVDKSLAKFKQRSRNVGQQAIATPVPQPNFRTFRGPTNSLPLLLDTFSKGLAGDDFVNRTPGMDRNLEDIIKKQNTGLEGIINYSDYGFPDLVAEAKRENLPQRNIDDLQNSPATLAIPTTRKQFMDIINAGPDAITNALTLGRIGYTTDPTTGKVSFTSGEFDFPAEGTVMEPVGDWINQGGLEGFYNRMKSKITGEEFNPDTQKPINIQPENVYNPNTVAALQYGDIEAQAEANRLRQEQTPYVLNPGDLPEEWGDKSFLSKQPTESEIRMNNWSEYGGFNPYEQAYYTDPTGSTLYPGYLGLDYGDPGFMPDFEKKYYESPYKTSLENYNSRLNQSIPTQPTGFEGTGYGGLSPQVTAPTQQANAFQPVATPISMQNEQQATGFQKVNDINNAFQKVNNEVLKPIQEQQQGLPSLMKIVDEQRNPTPVDPNAPYGYVEYTPPFIGGMAIPPGGIKPIRVPADQYGNPIKPGLKAI